MPLEEDTALGWGVVEEEESGETEETEEEDGKYFAHVQSQKEIREQRSKCLKAGVEGRSDVEDQVSGCERQCIK